MESKKEIKFAPTPKQQEFIDAVFNGKYIYLFYGGAAGGGKTYVMLGVFIFLCKLFPNSKWHIIRRDTTKLEKNTIPSFNKIVPWNFVDKFVDNVAHFTNGSQLHFVPENFHHDKDLTWMDGLETNGFGLEEVQELQKRTIEKAKLRAGRHIIDPMPPIRILLTGNPSQNWSKAMFVVPWIEGKLKEPYYYLPALMKDNPYLDSEYVKNMETLDSVTYQRYVLGNWDIVDVDKPYAYGFKYEKHIGEAPKPLKTLPLYLSFDFNIDPMTCIVAQHNNQWIRVIKEYRLRNSNTFELCKAIKADFGDFYFYVTGDATGRNRNPMVRDNLNHWLIIQKELNLTRQQLMVPTANPRVSNARIVVNAIMERHPEFMIDVGCKFLMEDLLYVEVNENGEIDKTKDKHRSHLLDCLIYYLYTFHKGYIKHEQL